jgi:hypothetical protein
MKLIVMTLLGTSLLAACAISKAQYKLSASAPTQPAPHAATCDFRVVNTIPDGKYDEIATLSIDWETGTAAMDPDDFKLRVRPDVCRVGGDVVITEINGYGAYVRGTVLRKSVAQ